MTCVKKNREGTGHEERGGTHLQSILQSPFRLYQPTLDGIVFVLERMISRIFWLPQKVLCYRGQRLGTPYDMIRPC